MTPAEARILADVRRDGVRVYNGRARQQITNLQTAGLVEVEWAIQPRSDHRHVWRITVRPTKGA